MERFIARANIKRFRRLIAEEPEGPIRARLERMLAEEEEKLRAFCAGSESASQERAVDGSDYVRGAA